MYSPPASSRAGRDTAGISEGDGWNGCRGRDNVTMTVVVTGRVTELPGTNQAMSEPVGRRFHCNWKEARRPFIDSFCFPSPPPSDRVPFVAELHSHLFTYSLGHSLTSSFHCYLLRLYICYCLYVCMCVCMGLSLSLLPFLSLSHSPFFCICFRISSPKSFLPTALSSLSPLSLLRSLSSSVCLSDSSYPLIHCIHCFVSICILLSFLRPSVHWPALSYICFLSFYLYICKL